MVELNPDTTVEPDWLFPLVEAVQQPGVGLATARVMLMANPKQINACGNEMSLTGLTFCIGVGESAPAFPPEKGGKYLRCTLLDPLPLHLSAQQYSFSNISKTMHLLPYGWYLLLVDHEACK